MFTRYTCTAIAALLAIVPTDAQTPAPPILTLPDAEAVLDEPLSSITPGAVFELRDGRVLVADARERVVRLANLITGEVTPVGREGRGPVEYRLPERFLAGPADSALLYDPENRRYLLFDPQGTPRRSINLQLPTGGPARNGGTPRVSMLMPARAADERGNLFVEVRDPGGTHGSIDSIAVVRRSLRTPDTDTLFWITEPRQPTQSVQAPTGDGMVLRRSEPRNPLAARTEWAAFPDGRVAVVHPAPYRVDFLLPGNEWRKGTPIVHRPVRVTDAVKAEEEQRRNAVVRGSIGQLLTVGPDGERRPGAALPEGARLLPLTNYPDVKPPFLAGPTSIWARPDGTLWMRRTEDVGAQGELFDVIDERGAVMHQVRIPAGRTVVGFGRQTVYTVHRDHDDLVYLSRHRVPTDARPRDELSAARIVPLGSIPVRVVRRLLFVELRIDSSEPLTFILDSGAGGTVVDLSTAERIGLRLGENVPNVGANGSSWARRSAPVTVHAAGLEFRSVAPVALDLEPLARAMGFPVHGVIGYALLAPFVAEHDVEAGELRFHEPRTFRPSPESRTLPFTLAPNRLIHVPVTFRTHDGRRLRVRGVIDSGSQRDFAVYENGVRRHGLHDSTRVYGTVVERGSENIEMHNLLDTLPEVGFAGDVHSHVPTVLMINAPNTVRSPGHDIEAMVGQGLLLRYHVTYDYTRRVLHLRAVGR